MQYKIRKYKCESFLGNLHQIIQIALKKLIKVFVLIEFEKIIRLGVVVTDLYQIGWN
jgi:hypothetical protein